MNSKSAPVVAELGRPETPAETANRQEESRQRRRQSQTLSNLVIALFACLAVVLLVVTFTEQPGPNIPKVDYQKIALQADVETALASPALPSGWSANSAKFAADTPDNVATWYIGFLTPKNGYIGLKQGIDSNPTWIANQLDSRRATGSKTISGLTWSIYDYRSTAEVGNLAYVMQTQTDSGAIVLFGTASEQDFDVLASNLAAWQETQK